MMSAGISATATWELGTSPSFDVVLHVPVTSES